MNLFGWLTALLATMAVLAGCAHRVETGRLKMTDAGWQVEGEDNAKANETIDGVLFYEPMHVVVRHRYTRLMVDGKVAMDDSGLAPLPCQKITQKDELVLLPDLSKPVALLNKPGWFASGQMHVTLTNGMLLSLNTNSDPELAEIISAIKGQPAVPVGGPAPSPGGPKLSREDLLLDQEKTTPRMKPACNGSPEILLLRATPQ